MSETEDPMIAVLDSYAKGDIPVTLRLKGDLGSPMPMGPGRVTKLGLGMYIFEMPVIVGQPGKPGSQTQATMPIAVRASDVLWTSTGVQIPDEPKVIAPPGSRSPGGIYT